MGAILSVSITGGLLKMGHKLWSRHQAKQEESEAQKKADADVMNSVDGFFDRLKEKEKAQREAAEQYAEPAEPVLTPAIKAAKQAYAEGQLEKAKTLYTEALAAEEAKPAPDWLTLSVLNNDLGLTYNELGQSKKALEYYRKDLAICLKEQGPEHLDVAITYNNISIAQFELGEFENAKSNQLEALAIREKVLGSNHETVVAGYIIIGNIYNAQKNFPRAKAYWKQAHSIRFRKLGPDHNATKLVKAKLDQLAKDIKGE